MKSRIFFGVFPELGMVCEFRLAAFDKNGGLDIITSFRVENHTAV